MELRSSGLQKLLFNIFCLDTLATSCHFLRRFIEISALFIISFIVSSKTFLVHSLNSFFFLLFTTLHITNILITLITNFFVPFAQLKASSRGAPSSKEHESTFNQTCIFFENFEKSPKL